MSLTNPNTPVSQQDLQDFYHKILPYIGGGSGGGGGHTIEDAEGTDLTQRDTMQFGTGFNATDDSENEKTVVEADLMQSGDMDDIVTPLPTVAPKKEGIKYSTTEQVIGEWIDNKPLYQKTVDFGALPNSTAKEINHNIDNVDLIWVISAFAYSNDKSNIFTLPQTHTTKLSGNIAVQANRTILQVVTGVDRSELTNCYITIQYTKTTDTPNT